MSVESLCIRAFAETIREKMDQKACIKNFDSENNLFQSDSEVKTKAAINLTGVYNFYKLLLDAVIYISMGKNEDGIPDIDATMATQLKKGKWEVHQKIKEIAQRKSAKKIVSDYFAANLIPNIPKSVRTNVLDSIDDLVRNSEDVRKRKKDALRQAYRQRKSDAEYLADVWLFAICNGTNIIEDYESLSANTRKSKISQDPFEALRNAEALIAMLPAPKQITPPEQPGEDEQLYIKELYAAYGDKEGINDFCEKHLTSYINCEEDLKERRIDYFAAESIRRGVLELSSGKYINQFDVLKGETYSGVKDTARRKFEDGYDRMLAVMEQAVIIQVNQYILSRSPYWISNEIKKGVCHFLVNDNKIKWVKK